MKKLIAAFALLALTACQTSIPQAPLGKDHALTGKIWSVTDARFVSYEDLLSAASEATFVLLGEKHDNPDHHRHQATITRDLIKAGQKPAVAFEMLTWDQQPALDAHLKSRPADVRGLGEAVNWAKSGWPDWSLYAPIADASLAGRSPIIAANFPRTLSRKLGRQGFAALPAGVLARSKLDVPLTTKQTARLEEDIYLSHCKMMPKAHLGPVVKVQQARDAVLADALVEATRNQPTAILIAGSGHVRNDRAVPHYLRLRQPGKRIFSLAFLEVQDDDPSPSDYVEPYGDSLPFDYIWFTARLEDIDPCEKFKAQLQKMKKKKP